MRNLTTALLLAATALLGATTTTAAAASFGMGDQNQQVFNDARFTALKKIKTVRYIAPWDVQNDASQRAIADNWIAAAKAKGYKVHVAFNYSYQTPTKVPTVAAYTKATKAFVARHKSDVEVWGVFNEVNRGTVKGRFTTPNAKRAAELYKAFSATVCKGCKIVGVDLLDGQSIKPTLKYLAAFKKAVGSKQPKIWGFHNYSDVNRKSTSRTAAYVKATKTGEVWLTETGGLYEFGANFAPSTSRQSSGTKAVFAMAKKYKRIKRVYFYNFFGPGVNHPDDIFDAGIIGGDNVSRPAYDVLKTNLG